MTLNDPERRNIRYFAFFSPHSIALLASYITVGEDRPIISAKYSPRSGRPLLAKPNPPYRLQFVFSAVAELLVTCLYIREFVEYRRYPEHREHNLFNNRQQLQKVIDKLKAAEYKNYLRGEDDLLLLAMRSQ